MKPNDDLTPERVFSFLRSVIRSGKTLSESDNATVDKAIAGVGRMRTDIEALQEALGEHTRQWVAAQRDLASTAERLKEAERREKVAGSSILTSVYNYLMRTQNGIRSLRRAAQDPIIQFEYRDIASYYDSGLDFIHAHRQTHFEDAALRGMEGNDGNREGICEECIRLMHLCPQCQIEFGVAPSFKEQPK